MPPRTMLKLVPPPAVAEASARGDGEQPDFATLFELYSSWVAALASRLCGRSADVDDIVQDVFFVCARKLGTITSAAEAKPWLRTVTVRVVKKRMRLQRWGAWFRSSDDGLTEIPYQGLRPDEHAMLQALYRSLEALPVDERLAWTLRHVEGASLEEVAQGCGCSLATAKRRIARAAGTLREKGHDASEA
jgi:RNA polymerase sigma-70 factor (ECF subfamily)